MQWVILIKLFALHHHWCTAASAIGLYDLSDANQDCQVLELMHVSYISNHKVTWYTAACFAVTNVHTITDFVLCGM